MMTIEFWKSNYTYFSIGTRYGVSESYAYKIIKRFENYLIDSGEFSLRDIDDIKEAEVVIIDTIVTKICRPNKSL